MPNAKAYWLNCPPNWIRTVTRAVLVLLLLFRVNGDLLTQTYLSTDDEHLKFVPGIAQNMR